MRSGCSALNKASIPSWVIDGQVHHLSSRYHLALHQLVCRSGSNVGPRLLMLTPVRPLVPVCYEGLPGLPSLMRLTLGLTLPCGQLCMMALCQCSVSSLTSSFSMLTGAVSVGQQNTHSRSSNSSGSARVSLSHKSHHNADPFHHTCGDRDPQCWHLVGRAGS